MDDLLDLSPLEQELEALSAIYLDELRTSRTTNGQIQEVELELHPATGDDAMKFVRMNLVFQPTSKYPDEVPEIIIRNPRGLGEEEIVSLVEDMREKAWESVGEMMLYTLIEMAKETLTEGNIPHCPCVVCLEHFQDHELFHRTACYHYFHTRCLHKYLEHSRQQIERDKEEAAEHKHLNPKDSQEEAAIVCPVCRMDMDEDSLAVCCSDTDEEGEEHYVMPPELREQQRKMAELYEKQKAKGAIIDVEWERNKYLVNPDERLPIPVLEDAESNSTLSKEGDTVVDVHKQKERDNNAGSTHLKGSDHRKKSSEHSSKHPPHRRYNDHHFHSSNSGARAQWRDGPRDRKEKGNDYHKPYKATQYDRDRYGRKESGREAREKFKEAEDIDTKSDCSQGIRRKVGNRYPREDEERTPSDSDTVSSRQSGDVSRSNRNRDHESNDMHGIRFEGRRDNWRRGRGRGTAGGIGEREHNAKAESYSVGRSVNERNYSDGRESVLSATDNESLNGDSEVSRRFEGRRDNWRRGRGRGTAGSSGEREHNAKADSYSVGRTFDDRNYSDGRGSVLSATDNESLNGESDVSRGSKKNDERWQKENCHDDMRRKPPQRQGRGRGTHQGEARGSLGGGRNRNTGNDGGAANYPSSQHRQRQVSREGNSEDEFKKQHGSEEQQGHDRPRQHHQSHHGGRGGRRTEFSRRDEGRGRGHSHRFDRAPVGGRSDRRGIGSVSVEEEDEEEGRRQKVDLKNLEINRKWRELNFGSQSSKQEENGGKKVFQIIDDDGDCDSKKIIDESDDDSDDESSFSARRNPNYYCENAHSFYSVASDSDEDWEKESDPFGPERKHIRPAHFAQYTKYKAEHAAFYAKKVDKRAARNNAALEEEKRIQRERLSLTNKKEDSPPIAGVAEESESLSVLERFKKSKEQSKEKASVGKSDGKKKAANTRTRGGNESIETDNRNFDDSATATGKQGQSDGVDSLKKKSETLPRKSKAEGIKWVGVRSQEEVGNDGFEDVSAYKVAEKSAFADSWKRREEKDTQSKKQKGKKKNRSVMEAPESHSDKADVNNTETTHCEGHLNKEDEKNPLLDNAMRDDRNTFHSKGLLKHSSSINGVAQVSSLQQDTSTSTINDHPASDLNSKVKKAKPLDFRKKNCNGYHQPHVPSDNTVENLVDSFPSLLAGTFSLGEETRMEVQEKSSENTEKSKNYSQNDLQELDSNGVINRSSNNKKPRPLDFRKKTKKGS